MKRHEDTTRPPYVHQHGPGVTKACTMERTEVLIPCLVCVSILRALFWRFWWFSRIIAIVTVFKVISTDSFGRSIASGLCLLPLCWKLWARGKIKSHLIQSHLDLAPWDARTAFLLESFTLFLGFVVFFLLRILMLFFLFRLLFLDYQCFFYLWLTCLLTFCLRMLERI